LSEFESVFDSWSKFIPKDFPLQVPAKKAEGTLTGKPDGIKEIFWIGPPEGAAPNFSVPRLAIVLRPRGGQFLRSELIKFKEAGIRILVSLMEAKEAVDFGLADEPAIADELGLMFLPFPIRDHSLPRDPVPFRGFCQDLAERLKAGRAVGIHCQGSVGRAPVVAACTLIHLGWKPGAALAAIHEARGCMVPDTQEQEDWIMNYKA
jgi:protein-tyrosine phosphatase